MKTRTQRSAWSLAWLTAAACGGQANVPIPVGKVSVQGIINGGGFPARDSIGVFAGDPASHNNRTEVGVIITDEVLSCSFVSQNSGFGSTSALLLLVRSTGDSRPGTYAFSPVDLNVGASYEAACLSKVEEASGGTITLTEVNSATISGSFDAVFPNGDHLSGTFSAPVCATALDTLTASPAPPPPACPSDS